MHTVDSPSSEPSSPEITTASVSPYSDHAASGIPVDSPQFATLSPRRALKARRVRAFDEGRLSEYAKAVEIEEKGEGEGERVMHSGLVALALALLILVCFVGSIGSGGSSSNGSSIGIIANTRTSSPMFLAAPAMQTSPAFAPFLASLASLPSLPEKHSTQVVESHAEGMRSLQVRTGPAALLEQASSLVGPVALDVWHCDAEVQGHAEGVERLRASLGALSRAFAQESEIARGAQVQLCHVMQTLHAAAERQRVFIHSGGLWMHVNDAAHAAKTTAGGIFEVKFASLNGAWEAVSGRKQKSITPTPF